MNKYRLFLHWELNLMFAYLQGATWKTPWRMSWRTANQLIAPQELTVNGVMNVVFAAFEEYEDLVFFDRNEFIFSPDIPNDIHEIISGASMLHLGIENYRRPPLYSFIYLHQTTQSNLLNLGDSVIRNTIQNGFPKISTLLFSESVFIEGGKFPHGKIVPVLPLDAFETKTFRL